jgi:hypothetical protein
MDMQHLISQISNASASKGGNNLRDGKYKLIIERVVLNKGHEGTCVIPELRVVSAERVEQGVEPNDVGSSISCVWNLEKHRETAPGNVKSFVLAVTGMDEGKTPAEEVQKATASMLADPYAFRGLEVEVTTYRKTNQGKKTPANRGQILVLPAWKHVTGQTPETVMANRAALGGTAAPAPAPQPEKPVAPPPPVATPPASGFLAGMFNK